MVGSCVSGPDPSFARGQSLTRVLVALAILGLLGWGLLAWIRPLLEPSGTGRTTDAPPTATDRPHPQGGIYRFAVPEPDTLNPFRTVSVYTIHVIFPQIFDSLLGFRDGRFVPRLAETFERSGSTLHLRLRRGVRFADGSPLTAEDVRFSFDAVRSEGLPRGWLAGLLDACRRVEVRDGEAGIEVSIEFHRPQLPPMLEVATLWPIVSKAAFSAEVAARRQEAIDAGHDPGSLGALLGQVDWPGPGTGPYRLAGRSAWQRGSGLRLERNELAWHRAVEPQRHNLGGFEFRFDLPPEAELAAARSGVIDQVVRDDAEQLLERSPELAANYRALSFVPGSQPQCYVVWNHRRAPFGDARVRRALTMLFDREALVRDVKSGNGIVAAGLFRRGTAGAPDEVEPLPFDPVAARKLLAQAGFDGVEKRLRFEFLHGGIPEHEALVALLRDATRRIGVELVPVVLPYDRFLERLDAHEFDGALYVWQPSDVLTDPYDVLHTDGATNHAGYSSPAADALIEAARSAFDGDRRAEAYRGLARLWAREQPLTFLYHNRFRMLLHRRVHGVFDPGHAGDESLYWIESPK